jgi:Tol biopolymer transport system component
MIKDNPFPTLLVLLIVVIQVGNYSPAQSWLYLGQEPPGMEPQRFPPDSLLANEDWFWHGSPSFSPDGREMYWAKYQVNGHSEIWFVECVDSHWTSPQIAPFASGYAENNALFSPDGDSLYYQSTRPGGFIFLVTRTLNGWSEPVPLGIPVPTGMTAGLQFSITGDKSIYFELWEGSNLDLYKTKYSNGDYLTPVNLGNNINSDHLDFTPFVHPDEDYLIFNSDRPGGEGSNDLYISFQDSNGDWSEAQNMGTIFNSDAADIWPYVTPDGNYFYRIKAGEFIEVKKMLLMK